MSRILAVTKPGIIMKFNTLGLLNWNGCQFKVQGLISVGLNWIPGNGTLLFISA